MEMNPSLVEITGDGLTITKVASVARLNRRVALVSDPSVREKIFASRRLLEKKLAAKEIIYGVNTGFGGNARYLIPSSEISKHQENMFQFLACGVGAALPQDTVRAAMLLRANALAKGFSGVRLVIIERLLELLNKDITPVVPRYGSVGASGDLIPSAYIARVLLGQGEVYYQGTVRPADRALVDAGMEPLRLEAKEALALVNGTTVMNGIGSLVIDDGAYLTASVLACVSLALEALRGTDDPFKDAVQRAKHHPGQVAAASFCRELLDASTNVRNLDLLRDQLSETREAKREGVVRAEECIQSPYSLRCAPQGLGPIIDALEEYRRTLEREANSVNDNPLIDPDRGEIYHTGNFYGGHVARALDGWKIDLATLANWVHAIMAMLVDERFSNGLPSNLSPNPGVSTGFKGVQLCLTSLVCALRQLAQPSMIHTLPTEQYNQDVVSLGTHSALTAMDMTAMAREAVAMVLIAVCQAIDLRRSANNLGKGNQAIYAKLRSEVRFVNEDRPLDRDIAKAGELIQRRLMPLPDWRAGP